jgi:hypothetical protein
MAAYLQPTKLYKFHVANLRSLQLALENTVLSARKAISEEQKEGIQSFTRLYAFLVGAWTETRLQKLINENAAFTVPHKEIISGQRTQLDQWLKSIELSFRKHYNLPNAEISEQNVPHTAFHRYESVVDIINCDLRPVIEVRNKLAHGQWVYPLNSDSTDVEQDKFTLINHENILSLQFKFALISKVAEIVHDLAVSPPTFERDFDAHYKHIVEIRRNLKNRSYDQYRDQLIQKREKGIRKRRAIRQRSQGS